ncbi:beta-lactamase [Mesobacillus campisalis]|uniref:Beta-lactamase n=1 Tax=Mesobacillus campisalis TaxID=1408103 RepID=A0A0M2SP30_9BACI|nr:MBL fold metallo-hydrolase [Mesobacillus campisalis]KKK34370.1 beta-lactamase [Mesobacillus campisalis]
MGKPMQLTEKIHLIDGHDLGMEERTGSYVLMEDDITLIETSASPSVPHILAGLKDLGLAPSDIKYIIVTHIHLDHSGGAGLLLTYCPNAKIVVHPKGQRHLANPSRLITSAKAVYREKFEALFDPILPVPEENILVKADGETLQISEDCVLTFHDSPGHANHHFSIFHPGVKGLFSGDTIGIYYPQLARRGIELYIPSTSPNQFDPDKMLYSIETFEQLKAERLFFGHFGMSEHPEEAYSQVKYWLEVFCSTAETAFSEGSDFEERTNLAAQKLYGRVKNQLLENGLNDNDPIFELLSLDLQISSMGLIDYLTRKK